MAVPTTGFRQRLIATLTPETVFRESPEAWYLGTANPGLNYLSIGAVQHRLVSRRAVGLGFCEWLLGARYGSNWTEGQRPPVTLEAETLEMLEKEATRGRFVLVVQEDLKDPDTEKPVPLFTLFKNPWGQTVMLESNTAGVAADLLHLLLLLYGCVLAGSQFNLNQYDADGDFLVLGAPNIVERHSSELLRKQISYRVAVDRDLCNNCLLCTISCAEMKAVPGRHGPSLIGPAEAHCTNCGLCRQKCPYIVALPKDESGPTTGQPPGVVSRGGEAVLLSGGPATSFAEWLEKEMVGGEQSWPLEARMVASHSWSFNGSGPEIIRQYRIAAEAEVSFDTPVLITTIAGDGRGSSSATKVILRPRTRAVVVLATPQGKIEADMALAALRAGARVKAVMDPDQGRRALAESLALRQLHRDGALEEALTLEELLEQNQVDLVLTPFLQAVSPQVHAGMLARTGTTARIMAPQILQAFTFSHDPLLNELRQVLLDIFPRYPELMEAEASLARTYLSDIDGHSAEIHARYRSMALGSGHSACPTCAELQVLAVPLYMAILFSLARGEIPEVTFTCETGCMSETLNKVKEAAQKVRGGRTVFGGGFAFGEAVALSEEVGIRQGWLPKQRRYVVSQSGDGGSVIGLPAWLNALRQKAFLVPQRQANVLHFINITDTQVYSNTGGESSASSMLGMGTLTTPIGQFILGNQRIQWNLINLAAEFPGILVGLGHSADKTEMQKFWHRADLLGRSAIRWDVTPCPETGKFFGEDPDHLAMAMAHAGFLPQVEFVGRLRKRIAPINPGDRGKPWRQWDRKPKPIYYWLERDPRYRALLRKNPQTGRPEPRNAAARMILVQLERYRDRLNLEIDLENRLVREAEEQVEEFFGWLAEQWQEHRHSPSRFGYHFLFNVEGRLKPEYGEGLKREMTEMLLNRDAIREYLQARAAIHPRQKRLIEELQQRFQELQSFLQKRPSQPSAEGLEPAEARILEGIVQLGRDLQSCSQESLERLERAVNPEAQPGPAAGGQQPGTAADRSACCRILDRLVEDRAVARQAEISQLALANRLRRQFLSRGGLITTAAAESAAQERLQLRRLVGELGPFAIGVASLAGERGIAINRIFSNLLTAKGAWAGMAWQFGSSKRGTPVLSATFVDCKPIERKDAMLSFPYYVLAVTNYEDLKANSALFFDNLHPEGYLIINTGKSPETVREELLAAQDPDTRELVAELQERPLPLQDLLEWGSRRLHHRGYDSLAEDDRRLVRKLVAMAWAHLIAVDMDGIIREVTGSERTVANLVAVAPIFKALQQLGLPLDLERDRQDLLAGFPGAVLRNKTLLNHYLEAIHLALERARGFPASPVAVTAGGRQVAVDQDPATHLMAMGGTIAGMILSQVATAEHPLCYVGFPITPAGNPFYAMADAFANGHPYIYVDEVNPSEKVAAEKLIGIARTGGMLPVTFTASQGWRLFTEIIPQFVGARLEGLFLIAKRSLAAPVLNIEESHTDFMSFRDDGGLMLAPKSIQEYVPALYLARLMTHFAKLPVVLSVGGITDTHKIGLVRVPTDNQVRAWLAEVLRDFDFLEHKLLNRQGQTIVHGPSATAEFYQETQSEVERAHQAAMEVLPYAVAAVRRLTGYTFSELEMEVAGDRDRLETMLVLQGSLYPNAAAAVRELGTQGWRGLGCLSLRWFNPFPAEKLAEALRPVRSLVVLDRSNSFGSDPPLASRVMNALARHRRGRLPLIHLLVGGLGGREITVDQMRELMLFAHLVLRQPAPQERKRLAGLVRGDNHLQALLDELAALHLRNLSRHTRVPPHLRRPPQLLAEKRRWRRRLERLLSAKQYSAFLTNYGAVAFVGAKEALGETDLLKRAVLRLEILHARQRLSQGSGELRQALLLLHYSDDLRDWKLAANGLSQLLSAEGRKAEEVSAELLHFFAGKLKAAEVLPGLLAAGSGPAISESLQPPGGGNQAQVESPPAEPQSPSKAKPPAAEGPESGLEFSSGEEELIRFWLAELVRRNASREMFFNPEDFVRALIQKLSGDRRSQLYQADGRPKATIVAAYNSLYQDTIQRALHREILVQDFAPELQTIFEGDGEAALELVARGTMARLQMQGGSGSEGERLLEKALDAARAFLEKRVLPSHPKRPGFYLDYYQAVVEPQLRWKINSWLAASRP